MDFIIAIVMGGIIGWLASLVMNRDASMGIFWNIIVGCVGSILGWFLFGFLWRLYTLHTQPFLLSKWGKEQ